MGQVGLDTAMGTMIVGTVHPMVSVGEITTALISTRRQVVDSMIANNLMSVRSVRVTIPSWHANKRKRNRIR